MMSPAEFVADPGWIPFHPDPSRPAYRPPAGAVDAHCHVFGPGRDFPYAPERKYTPSDAPKQKLWELRDFLGFSRSVIVQASCHGTDNRAMQDALRESGGLARGVAVVRPDIGDDELQALHADGVRGIRFNFLRRLATPPPPQVVRELARRIAPLGWHVVVYFEASELERLTELLGSLPLVVVVDHMGRPDVTRGVDGPEFERFLGLMRDCDNVWSKVSGAERLSKVGAPGFDDIVPFSRRVVETFPDRVLWGTDWPHPNMTRQAPDDGQLVDLLPRIAPNAELRLLLLVDNPMRLYWREQER